MTEKRASKKINERVHTILEALNNRDFILEKGETKKDEVRNAIIFAVMAGMSLERDYPGVIKIRD